MGDALGGEKGQEHVLSGGRDAAEGGQFLTKFFGVFLGDGERALRELDLDYVDGVIGAVEEKIDLSALGPSLVRAVNPAAMSGLYLGDAERLFELGEVFVDQGFQ